MNVKVIMFAATHVRQNRVALTYIQCTKPNGLFRVLTTSPAGKPTNTKLMHHYSIALVKFVSITKFQ